MAFQAYRVHFSIRRLEFKPRNLGAKSSIEYAEQRRMGWLQLKRAASFFVSIGGRGDHRPQMLVQVDLNLQNIGTAHKPGTQ
jgi:hypothetical protein